MIADSILGLLGTILFLIYWHPNLQIQRIGRVPIFFHSMSLTHHFRKFSFASSVVALASPLLGMTLFSSVAQAQNLVKNGGFENNSGAGQLLWQPVTDWTLVITGISTLTSASEV